MNVTVIICTYNRSESLKRTLQSLKVMLVPDDTEWELLIIDNNSTDNTKDVIARFISASGLHCRYFLEKNQGHSHARNRGIKESCGDIIAYTDDDVMVHQHWLKNIAKAFEEDGVSCVGGKVFPIWEKPCPKWLFNNLWSMPGLYGALALLDYGDKPLYLDKPKIWGANIAFRKIMFEKYGAFNTSLGRIYGKLSSFDETDFLERLIKNREKIYYSPEVIVYHCIPSRRMRKSYFRKWRFDNGEMSAILMGPCNGRNIMGVPLYKIRQTGNAFFQWMLTLPFAWQRRFPKELALIDNIGYISGRLRVMWQRSYKS